MTRRRKAVIALDEYVYIVGREHFERDAFSRPGKCMVSLPMNNGPVAARSRVTGVARPRTRTPGARPYQRERIPTGPTADIVGGVALLPGQDGPFRTRA